MNEPGSRSRPGHGDEGWQRLLLAGLLAIAVVLRWQRVLVRGEEGNLTDHVDTLGAGAGQASLATGTSEPDPTVSAQRGRPAAEQPAELTARRGFAGLGLSAGQWQTILLATIIAALLLWSTLPHVNY